MKWTLAAAAVAITAVAFTAFALFPSGSPPQVCSRGEVWSGSGLFHPMGLAWDGRFLYLADAEHGAVKKFASDGSFVAEWRGFRLPVAIAAAGEVVYVADFLSDRISKLRADGTLLAQWGRHGSGPSEFAAPSGLAADGQGHIFVTDFYNHRVEKFDNNGRFLTSWGKGGRWSGEFHYPTDIATSPSGAIYVADAYNHRIQRFAADGAYLGKWGGIGYGVPGKWPGWFRLAKALAVDPSGNVYVADAFNHRIQKFTADGQSLGVWSGDRVPPLRYPAGIAAGNAGALFVSDFFENRIWKLDCRRPQG